MNLQHVKGTFDILPDSHRQGETTVFAAADWTDAENRIRAVLARHDFEEIRTPILEPTELIARGVGQSTDIVQKEMFSFKRGDDDYVLRPEVTASVMRAYLEHRLDQRGGVRKLFYLGPCFRAEQPQKGRYRQFHQFGTETMGTEDPAADAETIAAMLAIYREFGITNTVLRLNSLGESEDRARFREALKDFLAPQADELSDISRRRLETNPLRVLDTKLEHEREMLAEAPVLWDFLSPESLEHYREVKAFLDALGIPYVEDPTLVRGLDYYSRTAFELESPDLGAQSALAGGGRYDGLAEAIGSEMSVPSVGFAGGMERLFLALTATGEDGEGPESPAAFFVALGDEARRAALQLAGRVREEGLRAGIALRGRSFKAQMREANRQRARFAVVIGDDEIANSVVQLKDMDSGEQQPVPMGALPDRLHSLLTATPTP